MSDCPCGSGKSFDTCCSPIISGAARASGPEALMRSRYSAFATGAAGFLSESLHPDHRHDHDEAATRRWAANAQWLGLEIVSSEAGEEEGRVEFIATFKEKGLVRHHHELSTFRREGESWYYVDGTMVLPETQVHETPKVGRNAPCPCGSGKKYKKCCGS
ncbi:MAG: hypothetical protein B0D96_03235 [Candidatus Sedimenticola endophacoides]|uniref:YchJ-like middle NTF2-like domain-containing protein n=1 Tax=Candidatus Sedimenticola endophacoides TaxID=2548426 RepID=A0A6N4DSZ9_9GAMM|nr:MAG: hypothetical protein B0D94_08205 [Candidatus Sedimenticola endophacoides]OQX36875.1 MAG: hypothetical protein B0D96_03235 [Candidatus Sedimenticola endophacoides]OQX40070.1 MAG: hypothetical protein B0D89_09085 [Candidatus Sedimenticola endophacoides]PUD98362.1 MAG: hypothetical protein C3L26_12790 [Candidatus Sedimenticola endophacoides]PUE00427.1 MAG: hypothetical protein C3L24_09305 [Candidatus Sedimenticola endophacoides]